MAKTDSLLYIKRYLKTFDGVEVTECINSAYYKIGNIKIRLSNHSKKQTKVTNKFDISIVQPVNDNKQYIVTIRGSLAMNIMNLTETKEFIRNYILIRQMDRFTIEEYDEETIKETEDKTTIDLKTDDLTDVTKEHSKLSVYLKHTYKWYSKRLSDNGKKHLRHYIIHNIKNENDLTDLMESLTERINKKPSKIFSKTEIENLIFLSRKDTK